MKGKISTGILIFFIFFLILLFGIGSTATVQAIQNDTHKMTVEANVIAIDPIIEINETTIIRIQIPDYINLGNVSKGEQSDEIKITINNTSNVDVIIHPELYNSNNEIFKYLELRKRKSGNSSTSYPIGQFTLNIPKPSSEGGIKEEYFWMRLDLTDFDGDIEESEIGRRAYISFIAMQA